MAIAGDQLVISWNYPLACQNCQRYSFSTDSNAGSPGRIDHPRQAHPWIGDRNRMRTADLSK